MDKKVAEFRNEQWREIIHECINRDPGISKRKWCEKHGIKFRSLMYWQRKFQVEALDQMHNSQTALSAPDAQTSVPAFVDVTAQYEAVQEDNHPLPMAPELMIQTGAYKIYINGSIHESTLKKVMRVIGHA